MDKIPKCTTTAIATAKWSMDNYSTWVWHTILSPQGLKDFIYTVLATSLDGNS